MKGVIHGINSRTTIVDITHDVPPGELNAGAFALVNSYRFFPKRTIHVAVVDPGVGGKRKAIAVQTSNYFFIGPDNGVLSWALGKEKIKGIRSLENERYFLKPISRTFHGRDIFSSVAAHLSCGVRMEKLGPALKEIVQLHWPQPKRMRNGLEGAVVYVDRFGNAITNLDAALIARGKQDKAEIFIGSKRLCVISDSYESVPAGHAVAVLGSTGCLEIAVNGGSAAQQLKLRRGDAVLLHVGIDVRRL